MRTTTWCSKVPRCCLKQTGPTYYTTRTSSYSWSSKSMFFSQCIDSGVISGRPGSTISYHIHCTGLAASYHTAYIVPARQHHIIPHTLYRPGSIISYRIHCTGPAASYHTACIVPVLVYRSDTHIYTYSTAYRSTRWYRFAVAHHMYVMYVCK